MLSNAIMAQSARMGEYRAPSLAARTLHLGPEIGGLAISNGLRPGLAMIFAVRCAKGTMYVPAGNVRSSVMSVVLKFTK